MPPGGPPDRPARPAGVPASLFLQIAHGQLGSPYTWGGSSPLTGFDCSGLVQWALTKAGLRNVPRTSEAQWNWVQHIPLSALQPGDLIFEQWPGDEAAPGHVAIFTGTGKIEEAPQPGEPVHEVPWSPGSVTAAGGRVVGYGRIPGLSGVGAGAIVTTAAAGLLSWPADIVHAFTSAGTALDWLLQPNHWVRIWAGVGGTVMVAGGVFLMSHAGGEAAGMAMIPRPASLPLGIALTGVGSVLLFVAFHNLPSQVTDLSTLVAWLVSSLRGNAAGTSAASGSSSSSGAGSSSSGGGGGPAPISVPPIFGIT